VVLLEAHTSLTRLSPDVNLNHALITQHQYLSPSHIARAPQSDFVAAAGDLIGDFKAAQIHMTAIGQSQLLDNETHRMLARKGNGQDMERPDIPWSSYAPALADCGCTDCEAAVSPLAYLADLLDYTVRHVKNNGSLIDLQFLEDTFHQPFGRLPAACGEMDKQVRQVRLCIEVLRNYLAAHNITAPADVEKSYCLEAYTTLLTRLGTSYAEVRLARTDTADKRQALADRLGIDLTLSANLQQLRPDNLDALFLDTEATNPAKVTELALQALFGLVDTTRPIHWPRFRSPNF
jgi:hypothetical protein